MRFPLVLLALLEVGFAVCVFISFFNAKDASVPGGEKLEYTISAYAGACDCAAFFSIIAFFGEKLKSRKAVAMYKYASIFKSIAGFAAIIVLLVFENAMCDEAVHVDWAWGHFSTADNCSSFIIVMLTLPVAIITAFSLMALISVSGHLNDMRDDRAYLEPLLHDMDRGAKDEKRASLSPRAQAITFDEEATENPNPGKYNPSTGFYYSG